MSIDNHVVVPACLQSINLIRLVKHQKPLTCVIEGMRGSVYVAQLCESRFQSELLAIVVPENTDHGHTDTLHPTRVERRNVVSGVEK